MLNKIVLMGRLTADPEVRKTQGGVSRCKFTLAVERDFDRDKADFIVCTAWRQTADFLKTYFHKGDLAVVSGRLQIDQWEGAEGIKRREADVQVENVYFGQAKRKSDECTNGVYDGEPTDDYAELSIDDGDLPF